MLIIFLVLSGLLLTADAMELAVYYSIPGGAMLCFIFSLLWLPVAQLSHLLLVLAPLVLGPGGKFATHPPFPSSHLRVYLHLCIFGCKPGLCSYWCTSRMATRIHPGLGKGEG